MSQAKRKRPDPLLSLSYEALQDQFHREQAKKGKPTITKPQAKTKDPLMRLTHAKLVERYEDMLSHDEEIGDLALLTKSKLVTEIRRLEAVRPQIPVRTPPGLAKALRRASLQSGRLSATEVNAWLRTLPSSAAL